MKKQSLIIILLLFTLSCYNKENKISNNKKQESTKAEQIKKSNENIIDTTEPKIEEKVEATITSISNTTEIQELKKVLPGVIFPNFGYQMGESFPQDQGFKFLYDEQNEIIYIETIESNIVTKVTFIDSNNHSYYLENLRSKKSSFADVNYIEFNFYNHAFMNKGNGRLIVEGKIDGQITTIFDSPFYVNPQDVTIMKENEKSPFKKNVRYNFSKNMVYDLYFNNLEGDKFWIFENKNNESAEYDGGNNKITGLLYKPVYEIICNSSENIWSGKITIGDDLSGRNLSIGKIIKGENNILSWMTSYRIYNFK